MSGSSRFVLDTNAVVSLLAGNRNLAELLESAAYVGISIISYLEFLAFDGLSDSDRQCFASLCRRIEVVSLKHDDSTLIQKTLDLRREHRLKLPDAIIGATAMCRNATLITNDSHFSTIKPLHSQRC
jgi:predicted nucleic acid-binding protein